MRDRARKRKSWGDMCGQRERDGDIERAKRRARVKERQKERSLQRDGWRAPSIKQVFEKGRQREKVSAKYLKEC